jgi:formate-dependent nitrite reductase membrane component NrfD
VDPSRRPLPADPGGPAPGRAARRGPVILIPAVPQRLWRGPAVVNFVGGGLGAGLYAAATAASGGRPDPALAVASVLGPGLVLLGFAAVAAEAGRPLRGFRVLARPTTSWMSRELWLGGAFAALALAAWTWDLRLAPLAALVALAFAAAQGGILRAAHGVPAWSRPVMPLVFLASALASGAAALVLVRAALGEVTAPLLGALLVLVAVHGALWWAYLGGADDLDARASLAPLAGARGLALAAGAGALGPALLAGLALALPGAARPLAAAAGALVILAQAGVKAVLLRQAGRFRPITLPTVTPRRHLS